MVSNPLVSLDFTAIENQNQDITTVTPTGRMTLK